MNLPKKISPCPILESTISIMINIKDNIFPDAIFGIIYNELKNDYPNAQELPVVQIPSYIRNSDIKLKYAPYYQLISEDFILQIGPRIISLINPKIGKEYIGWHIIFEKIKNILKTINKLEIFESIEKIELQYVDFFKDINIFEKIKFKMEMSDLENFNGINIVTALEENQFQISLNISNNVNININNGLQNGSIIEIGVLKDKLESNDYEHILDIIEKAHIEQKKIFFNILKSEYLLSLNPEY